MAATIKRRKGGFILRHTNRRLNQQSSSLFYYTLLFTSCVFFSSPALSQIFSVEWYKPIVSNSMIPGRSKVILSGTTEPKSTIKISAKEILLVSGTEEMESLPTSDLVVQPQVIADQRGYFELILDLPNKTVQLPLEARSPNGRTKKFQMNLEVKENVAIVTNQATAKKSPYEKRTWSLWGGIGLNFLSYDQSTSIPSEITLKSFDMPTIFAKAAYSLDDRLSLQTTYNQAPGKTTSSPLIQVAQGEYHWTYWTAEATYFPKAWKVFIGQQLIEFGANLGAQYHSIPFIGRSSATSSTTASVYTNSMTMMAVGATALLHYSRFWTLEAFARYQVPYSTGSIFDVNSDFAFDGSMGAIYKLSPDLRLGLFWYGQYQKYRFTNFNDPYLAQNSTNGLVSGDQTLLFSNFEARIGWEFN